CPNCHKPITAQSREEIIERILQLPGGSHVLILAPLIRGQKGVYCDLFVDLLKQGCNRARVDGKVVQLADNLKLDRHMRHDDGVDVDRVTVRPTAWRRVAEAVELGLRLGQGASIVTPDEGRQQRGDATSVRFPSDANSVEPNSGEL